MLYGNASYWDDNFITQLDDDGTLHRNTVEVAVANTTDRLKDSRPYPSDLYMSPTSRSFAISYLMRKAVIQRRNISSTSYTVLSDPYPGPREFVDPEYKLKHLLRVNDIRADLSSAVAEWKRSHSGFVALGKQFLRIVRRIKKGKLPPSYKGEKPLSLDDAASTHLALHFGVKPLVNDAFKLVEALRTGSSVTPIRVVTREKLSSSYHYVDGNADVTTDQEVTISATSYWLPDTSLLGTLDLGNPLEWTWELIPMSFVVDYFIGIGDYLKALSPMSGLTRLGYPSITRRIKGSSQIRCSGLDGWTTVELGSVKFQTHERFILYQLTALQTAPQVKITKSALALQHLLALLVVTRKQIKDRLPIR